MASYFAQKHLTYFRGKDKIIISGIKDNVFDAHVAASDIVREYSQIIAIAEYVIWQYYDLQSHTFVDFSQRDSWKTELAHKVKLLLQVNTYVNKHNRTLFLT